MARIIVLPVSCFTLFLAGCCSLKQASAPDKSETGNFARGHEAVQTELQAANDVMNAAEKKKDLRTLMSFLTSDFTCVGTHGETITRAKREANWKGNFKAQSAGFVKSTKVEKLTVTGETAVIIIHNNLTFPFFDREMNGHILGPQKVNHTATLDDYERQIWVKTGSGWKMKRYEDLSGQLLVDGKVLETWKLE